MDSVTKAVYVNFLSPKGIIGTAEAACWRLSNLSDDDYEKYWRFKRDFYKGKRK